jgi:hypothetical protein
MQAEQAATRFTDPGGKAGAKATSKTVGLSLVLAALAAFVVYAAWREWRMPVPVVATASAETSVDAAGHAFGDHRRPALSAAEERFSQALWNLHAEARTAAVRMTFAGLGYKMGDGNVASVAATVAPLTAVFRDVETQLGALETPASMLETRNSYMNALRLYGEASREMIKVAQDGKDAHLLKAQEMSEQASGILLAVGESLWPGEIKPN